VKWHQAVRITEEVSTLHPRPQNVILYIYIHTHTHTHNVDMYIFCLPLQSLQTLYSMWKLMSSHQWLWRPLDCGTLQCVVCMSLVAFQKNVLPHPLS